MSIKTDFYAAFTAASDRPIRRTFKTLSVKGSIAFPSSKAGEYHGLAIVAYAGRFEDPSRVLIPRISLNHFRHDLSRDTEDTFNVKTGRPKYSGWSRSDVTLELTVTADELHHWPAWLWSFIKARESKNAALLLPDPSQIEGAPCDWLATRYEWSRAATKEYDEYRREHDVRAGWGAIRRVD